MAFSKADLVELLPNLRAFARSLCGNADFADDLVQEAILRAWNKKSSFETGTNLKAWIFTILRNYYFNELRKRKRLVELDGASSILEPSVHEAQPNQMHLKDLKIALGRLPDNQREALILVAVDGFSYEEAAHISGVAVGTIKSRVSRARRYLEAELGGADIDQQPSGPTPADGPNGRMHINLRGHP